MYKNTSSLIPSETKSSLYCVCDASQRKIKASFVWKKIYVSKQDDSIRFSRILVLFSSTSSKIAQGEVLQLEYKGEVDILYMTWSHNQLRNNKSLDTLIWLSVV